MLGRLLSFGYHHLTFTPKPLPPTADLSDKTVLITGASSALGYEAACELVSHHPSRLIIGVRDRSTLKCQDLEKAIADTNPYCQLKVLDLNYEDYYSIIAFASDVAAMRGGLHYVLLNAGVKKMKYTTSKTGHELNLQINHLGTSLLSLLFLPILQKTARKTGVPGRMTIVSSEGHFLIPFRERTAPNILARMEEPKSFGIKMQRYYTTKLLNVLWTRELANTVDPNKVVINTVNPGFCYSGLHRNQKTGVIKMFLWLFGWSSEKGGRCLTDALINHEDSHGKYLSEQRVTNPSKFVMSPKGEAAQRQIWDETLSLLTEEAPKACLTWFPSLKI